MENSYNNNSIISKKELTEPAELNNKLFIACKEGRLEDAKLLLAKGADINADGAITIHL